MHTRWADVINNPNAETECGNHNLPENIFLQLQSVLLQIGKSVERQLICLLINNLSFCRFPRPGIPMDDLVPPNKHTRNHHSLAF